MPATHSSHPISMRLVAAAAASVCAAVAIALVVLASGSAAFAQDKGYLGIKIRNLEKAEADTLGWEEPRGAWVQEVSAGQPAESAGVVVGDVIVSVDGTEMQNAEAVAAAIASRPPGTELALRLLRTGKERRVKVVLAVRPTELDRKPDGAKCSKYMPSIGKSVEVPCAPEG